ncbi:MAG: thioredoxin family protein [Chlamydiia bacterium]|nr:thioredoxin family protein [Chlamydiia bacterium]
MLKKFFVFIIATTLISVGMVQAEERQTDKQVTSGTQMKQGELKWYTNYKEAEAVAKKENLPMLLFFTGSDWCGWCKKIDKEIFEQKNFASAVGEKFVFLKLDFPMNSQLPRDLAEQNAMLKQKYGVTGFPTIVILDAQGNFLAETGYRPGGGKEYADYLMSLIQK